MKRLRVGRRPSMSMSLKQYRLTRDERAQIKQRFKRTGELTRKKLIEYIPAMLITNLSTLLLISVDGLVVGNLVGGKALSAVNIFSPATLLIGVISTLIASGIGICLSTGIGTNDPQKLLRTKGAMKKMMAISWSLLNCSRECSIIFTASMIYRAAVSSRFGYSRQAFFSRHSTRFSVCIIPTGRIPAFPVH